MGPAPTSILYGKPRRGVGSLRSERNFSARRSKAVEVEVACSAEVRLHHDESAIGQRIPGSILQLNRKVAAMIAAIGIERIRRLHDNGLIGRGTDIDINRPHLLRA